MLNLCNSREKTSWIGAAKIKIRSIVGWMSFLLYFQLDNMSLAFDLLRDTGFEVSSVNPQGEELTLWSLQRQCLKLKAERREKNKTKLTSKVIATQSPSGARWQQWQSLSRSFIRLTEKRQNLLACAARTAIAQVVWLHFHWAMECGFDSKDVIAPWNMNERD